MAHLRIENLDQAYGASPVLRGVSLEIPSDGRIYGVFGPNGAGKTTLFQCILGLTPCNATRLTWGEQNLLRMTTDEIVRAGIGITTQHPASLEGLSVTDYLELLQEERYGAANAEQVHQVLADHGISSLAKSVMGRISFGESRLVDFARAMLVDPQLLLLDEPFSGIDPHHIEVMKSCIRNSLSPPQQRAVLLTDHNLHQALSFVDHLWILYDGRVLFSGPPDDARRDQDVRRHYLGFAE